MPRRHLLAALLILTAGIGAGCKKDPGSSTDPLEVELTTPSLTCTVGIFCSATPATPIGGTSPYTYQASGGVMPAGMSFNSTTGEFSGTPSQTVNTTFTITVTDDDGESEPTPSPGFHLIVNPAPPAPLDLALTTQILRCVINLPCVNTPTTVTGGTSPYTYSATGGVMPTGMTYNTQTGTFTGTPTNTVNTTFTITVSDAAGQTDQTTSPGFQLIVATPLTISLNILVHNCSVGVPCSVTPAVASGGHPPYTYAATGGVMPPGMSFNSTTGAFSGTPSSGVNTTFTITATDVTGASVQAQFQLIVNAAPTPALDLALITPILRCTVNQPCVDTPTVVTGGTLPYTYSATGGVFPAGMTYSTQTGAFSGTPSNTVNTTFTITVTDAAGQTDQTTSPGFQLIVATPLIISLNTLVHNCSIGVPCSVTPALASGGHPSYTYAATGGVMPPGMSFNSTTGAFSGTPSSGVNTTFTITATDVTGASVQTQSPGFQLIVN